MRNSAKRNDEESQPFQGLLEALGFPPSPKRTPLQEAAWWIRVKWFSFDAWLRIDIPHAIKCRLGKHDWRTPFFPHGNWMPILVCGFCPAQKEIEYK